MFFDGNCKNKIHVTLKQLMERKSRRDGKEFTLYQLAKNLRMPHSIIIKLLHQNPERRVSNPKIDTLGRIVNFFKADGFDVTIDDLLHGLKSEDASQKTMSFVAEKTVPVYSFKVEEDKIAEIEITLPKNSNRVVALLSHESVCPVLGQGSIFIIDQDYPVKDGLLVAVKVLGHPHVLLGKIRTEGEKKIFSSDKLPQEIVLMSEKEQVIGVVVQVNPNMNQ